ncbi:MAG TPA: NlpC/P60 family protein [Gaiellaceae bacterium]|jgi:cell wall-associated NlpC family hydrolase|nr:NlpC/P60 family protein [Gaiellaceae bacterium]
MSRILAISAVFAVLAAPAAAKSGGAASANAKPASWAQREIKLVVSHGLMAKSVGAFRPNDPLTRGALNALVAGLRPDKAGPTTQSAAPVTMAQLDATLVRALDLTAPAIEFATIARGAGLNPPSRFGTEVVARLLGLRTNHPAALDSLELLPNQPATRAEAAYSAARILGFKGWEVEQVEQLSEGFQLPVLTAWQKRVLSTAVQFIGFPYVWGGTSEKAEAPFGVQAAGGFDCSGFVWRVFKLQAYPGGASLAGTLRGRTTFAMSGEVGAAKRIRFSKLRPADVLFWGAGGPRSRPGQVDHTGINLGNGWFIHSSGYGVALAPLDGWYKRRFAWARRPLAEAGLA